MCERKFACVRAQAASHPLGVSDVDDHGAIKFGIQVVLRSGRSVPAPFLRPSPVIGFLRAAIRRSQIAVRIPT